MQLVSWWSEENSFSAEDDASQEATAASHPAAMDVTDGAELTDANVVCKTPRDTLSQ